ncbi:hypothetical protein FUAX_25200 [Fulvitalea axinellae]|uniref:Uncharacterized protein n=1 Tax=Fulvitalea axinellae TaxID=1182444 RepID=A0AAU9D2A1_9BACT|nr:hypothetical protein FUAX_25200 [Fulvitalea axinellae]
MFVLKERLLERSTEKQLRKNKAKRNPASWENAQTAGILFTIGDEKKTDAAKRLRTELRNSGKGKKISLIAYFPGEKDCPIEDFDIFTSADFDWKGRPVHEMIGAFMDKPFDFLFHIDTEPNAVTDHLLAASKAKCRVGIFRPGAEDYYELMLGGGAGYSDAIQEMLHYIHVLEDYA